MLLLERKVEMLFCITQNFYSLGAENPKREVF